MKRPLFGLGLMLAATLGVAADAPLVATQPEWKGVMDVGNGKSFLVAAPGGKGGQWEKVGDTLGDWKVAEYREADRTLVLRRSDGVRLELVMVGGGTIAAAPLPPTGPNAYAVRYLMERAAQLKKDSEAAMKELDDFKEKHGGMDPSAMPPGAEADEGKALESRIAISHQNYVTILDRLNQTQSAANVNQPPPDGSSAATMSSGAK
jgi:hypothetical protein